MAEFATDLQAFRSSFHFLDIDPSMELINQFTGMRPCVLDNSALHFQSLISFSCDTSLASPQPQFERKLEEIFPSLVHHVNHNAVPVSSPNFPGENEVHESKKRKPTDVLQTNSTNSTPAPFESGSKTKNSFKRSKKVKSNVTDVDNSKDVVHVKAKRGQATDNHYLTERVRRGKINEKLGCLQDIVQGCCKFLSVKLIVASNFCDFNLETDALETMQVPTLKD
ncbi:transcription factor BEE 1-like isoform X2 [Prosopis cineraria]|uniref:transcription factor BEE 1-like isoform X2 n=1 Tax=Prosopis cineraria TaxID=364024 RepID=UPI0024106247|nr:transcription factor BEE 1-like isoform X2 [Prosopis cineraria]